METCKVSLLRLRSLRNERYRLDKVVLQSRHRKSYQNRGGNKTPEKSAALIKAKLEYLEILKKRGATEGCDGKRNIAKHINRARTKNQTVAQTARGSDFRLN